MEYSGFEAISAEIERIINDAEGALHVIWKDAERFAEAIRGAIARVDVVLFSFTRLPEHPYPTCLWNRFCGIADPLASG